MIAAEQRDSERRSAPVIGALDGRAKLEQQLQHGVIGPSCEIARSVRRRKGRVQGRLAVLEAGSTAREAARIVLDQALYQFPIAQGHRRKDVMPRPAREEQGEDGFVTLACRPADHPALVQVSGPVHVGAGVEQQADALERAAGGGKVERRRVVIAVAGVGIRAVLEQHPERVGLLRRQVQARAAARHRLPGELGIDPEELSQSIRVSGRARPYECRDGRRLAAVDLGLQCPPARKPVLVCHGELCGGEHGGGVRSAQQGQAVPRQRLEELERRTFGEIEGHGRGWVRPLTRPWAVRPTAILVGCMVDFHCPTDEPRGLTELPPNPYRTFTRRIRPSGYCVDGGPRPAAASGVPGSVVVANGGGRDGRNRHHRQRHSGTPSGPVAPAVRHPGHPLRRAHARTAARAPALQHGRAQRLHAGPRTVPRRQPLGPSVSRHGPAFGPHWRGPRRWRSPAAWRRHKPWTCGSTARVCWRISRPGAGTWSIRTVEAGELESLASRHDLLVVASGRATISNIFPRVAGDSPYTQPQRLVVGGLFRGIRYTEPRALEVNVIPGGGEILAVPMQSFEPDLTGLGILITAGGALEPLRHLRYDEEPPAFAAAVLEAAARARARHPRARRPA